MKRSGREKLFFARLLGLQKCLIMQNTCIYFLFIPNFSTINVRLIANILSKHIIHQQNTNKKIQNPISPSGDLMTCKGKGLGTWCSTAYTSQSHVQKCFTVLEVATDWHELMILQHIMRPSIALASAQLDLLCSMQPYHCPS